MTRGGVHPLFETWERTLAPFETSIAECRRTFADVASRYSEPGRHYHTLDHIGAVLATVRSISEAMAERPALSFAVFLHDAVYDTHASDNEERSAAFARDILQTLSVPEPIVEE